MKYLTKKGEIAMIKKLFITGLIVVATALVFHGCGGKLAGLKGAEEVVETSGKKPGMVSKNLWFEEQKDARFFLGFSDQAKDHDVALRVAELEGRKHIIEAIGSDIRVEGTRGLSGSEKESVGRFFEESMAYLTNNMRLSGAILQETYWEKWARSGYGDVSYYYKAYGIVRISREDYERARTMAADMLIGRAAQERNLQAERAAREAKLRLLDGAGQ